MSRRIGIGVALVLAAVLGIAWSSAQEATVTWDYDIAWTIGNRKDAETGRAMGFEGSAEAIITEMAADGWVVEDIEFMVQADQPRIYLLFKRPHQDG